MTKTQTWTAVQELLVANKANKKLTEALELLLAPKQGGGSMTNPPQEIDGVMNYYCRFHQAYEPVDDMVMSKDKSKGYCKASISKWNKTNADIKKLDGSMSALVADGNFEEAQVIANKSKDLKAILNDPKHYDLETDWTNFAGPKD